MFSSNSVTVTGLHTLWTSGKIDLILFSAALSLFSLTHGHVKHITAEKNNFLPITGKLLQMVFAILSILAKILSILLFFGPSLGLANLLMHWKMGQMTVAVAYPDKFKTFYEDLVFDVQNGEEIYFKDVWIQTPKYTSYTLWELETYYIIFLGLIPLHLALVFALKHLLAFGFR
jgi:hypothetical protein